MAPHGSSEVHRSSDLTSDNASYVRIACAIRSSKALSSGAKESASLRVIRSEAPRDTRQSEHPNTSFAEHLVGVQETGCLQHAAIGRQPDYAISPQLPDEIAIDPFIDEVVAHRDDVSQDELI